MKIDTIFNTKRKEIVLLLICLLALCLLYNYQYAFFKGPYSIHMWRQTDCLALTQGYYDNGLKFFEPCMAYQSGGSGKAVAEFPILYYVNAIGWTVFGKSELMYRILNVLITFVGLIYLYKLIRDLLDSPFWARIITLLVFSSPILVFYANGFLINVPAVSLIFISWYYFYKFYNSPTSSSNLIRAVFFITIAVLLRVTLFYAVSFIYILYFLELFKFGSFGREGALYVNKLKQFFILIIPLILVCGWVAYARYYNTLHGTTEVFLMKIIPAWNLEDGQFVEITRKFIHSLAIDVLLSYVGIYLFFGLILFVLAHILKFKKIISVSIVSLLVGFISYILLFYQNLNVHDYYLIEVIPLLVAMLASFVLLLKSQYPQAYQSSMLKYLFTFFLITSIGYCAAKHRIRYKSKDDVLVKASFFIYSEDLYNFWNWFHWDYDTKLKALETIEPKLRKLGIKKDDLVLSLPDPSPNVTLYMMGGQKGYSSFGQWDKSTYDQIIIAKEKGVKYLIVNDASVFHEDREKELVGKPIAEIENIIIYDICTHN